ncbi:bifunctional RNase H/acid phosphatase [Amycolatopsis sp. K13G38]|uniref:Bifunctional RNase H/acid phosphatase n=1 Tax=Amycolatopsis acididurans TaxID=2724524 RepID=A0ABX1JGI9_9PSEU|nr:bifunctional RNase H/acid phosphatase [Amycolatopsis acididurans]NKQ57367.1 bifunctional RNase H/acid phosphatase [Amycolatopsis acididurans]
MIVEADGGSRGNPGPAGYGAVVRDADSGAVLTERQAGLGVATNNVAEYTGLIAGLAAAAELGASTVDVRMDSKLVVEQMSGRWKVKHDALRALAEQARGLVARFERVGFEWIPRAENSHADRLANEAMDTQAGIAPAPTSSPARWTGARGKPTRLLLLRHGQTEMSIDRRYSGRGDVVLTEHGRQQAAAAAKRLAGMPEVVKAGEAVRIIASPLMRAKQTAQAVADAVGGRVETHQGLLETDFGEWEGLTFAEAAERDPELHGSWIRDTTVAPPGGESFESVHRRVTAFRDEMLEHHAGETVVVVSHVTPIKSILRLALDAGPSLLFRLHLDLASLSLAEFYPDGNASVRLANDTCHLT